MSFLQLVSSLDKTKDGFNSILPIVSFWPISQHIVQCNDQGNSPYRDLSPSPSPLVEISHKESTRDRDNVKISKHYKCTLHSDFNSALYEISVAHKIPNNLFGSENVNYCETVTFLNNGFVSLWRSCCSAIWVQKMFDCVRKLAIDQYNLPMSHTPPLKHKRNFEFDCISGFPFFRTDKIPWFFQVFLSEKISRYFFIIFKVSFPSGFEYKYANLLSSTWTKN